MKIRELSQDEIDAVSGGGGHGSSIRTGSANGGDGGNRNGAVSVLSGNSASVGVLTFGQRTGNGSNGNAVGGGNGGGGGNSGFAFSF